MNIRTYLFQTASLGLTPNVQVINAQTLRRRPGLHLLRIKDSETEIRPVAGKTLTITWFKDSFIEIPNGTVKPFSEINKELKTPPQKSKTDEGSGVRQNITKDPYYWPLNPRGPIY